MEDNASQLQKLADLKDRGLLTEEEFAKQKAALLESNIERAKPKMTWGKRIGAFVGFLCFVSVVDYAYNAFVADIPSCDDGDVKNKVVELANEKGKAILDAMGAGQIAQGLYIHGLSDAREVHAEQGKVRYCLANSSNGRWGYKIEWADKNNGEFFVSLMDPDSLEAQYVKQKPVTPVQPVATSPAPAVTQTAATPQQASTPEKPGATAAAANPIQPPQVNDIEGGQQPDQKAEDRTVSHDSDSNN